MPDAVRGEFLGDGLGLLRRDHRVIEPLQQQDGAGGVRHVPERGALGVHAVEARQRADQPVQVPGLEVVRGPGQAAQVGDAVVGGRGAEHGAVGGSRGHRGQRRPASGRAAADAQPGRVGLALLGQVPRGGHGVLDVDHPPLAAQPLPVEAAVPGGPAVVHVDHADAPAGEVRLLDVEPADRAGGRPAVHPDHVRRPLVRRAGRIRVGRRVHQRVHHPPVLARPPPPGAAPGDRPRRARRRHRGAARPCGTRPDRSGPPRAGGRARPPGRRSPRRPRIRTARTRPAAGRGRSARRSPGPAARAACRPGRAPPRAARHRAGRTAGRPAATAARRTPPPPGTAPGAARRHSPTW